MSVERIYERGTRTIVRPCYSGPLDGKMIRTPIDIETYSVPVKRTPYVEYHVYRLINHVWVHLETKRMR